MPKSKGKSKASVAVPKTAAKQSSVVRVSAPVAETQLWKAQRPKIRYEGDKCIVSHIERISVVTPASSSEQFALLALAVNPGLVTTFPWLAPFAQRFEKYKFRQLEFQYRSKCATSIMGDVSMALDYDAADEGPSTTMLMDNYDDSVNGSPWQTFSLRCSKENLKGAERLLYVRNGEPLEESLDIKTYDTGTLYVGVEGILNSGGGDTADILGYLFVSYEVELVTQQLSAIGEPLALTMLGESNTLANLLAGLNANRTYGSGVVVSVPESSSEHIQIAFAQPGMYIMVLSIVFNETGGGTVTFNFPNVSGAELVAQTFNETWQELVAGEWQQTGVWLIKVPQPQVGDMDVPVYELYATEVLPTVTAVDTTTLCIFGGASDGRWNDSNLISHVTSGFTRRGGRLHRVERPLRVKGQSAEISRVMRDFESPFKAIGKGPKPDGLDIIPSLKKDVTMAQVDAMLLLGSRANLPIDRYLSSIAPFVVNEVYFRGPLDVAKAVVRLRQRLDYLTDESHATPVPASAAGPKAGPIVTNGDGR